jgi:putative SOS response-associated peptidase YedK
VIERESYDAWLNATMDEAMTFLAPIPATQFMSAPAPK